jgi:dienelactone hydrolase
MDSSLCDQSFPQVAGRYSALRYLQAKLASRCAELPAEFGSLGEWQAFRTRLVAGLRERLPVWELGRALPSPTTARVDLGHELLLEAVDVPFEAEFFVPVHVYRASEAAGRLPAVLVCPGYGQRKNAQDIIDVCMALARAGMVALAMEYDGTGERADRPDFETDINNVSAVGQLLGLTNVGLRVMTNLAALRYLKTRDDVDATRLGITGLCQGAIVTWFTAAVCDDFAAVAPLCGATTYEAVALEYCNRQGGWSGISPYVFDLLSLGDVQHVLAAAAPRPLLVQNNLIDIHWPLSGFEKVKRLAEQVYRLYGAEANCTFRLEHGPHAYAGPFLANVVDWFATALGWSRCPR